MLLRNLTLALLASSCLVVAQTPAPAQGSTPSQSDEKAPQVRVNYLNVCTPSKDDQQVLATVINRASTRPAFAVDMEISRGRSSLNPSDMVINTGQPPANTQQASSASRWVRIRRDFPDGAAFTNVQYSFSVTDNHVAETMVVHFKDAKDVLQLSINDSVDAAADPGAVARLQTPADRIRVERFGKSSIVLARCQNVDQTAYEPLFRHATDVLNSYRKALAISATVPSELARLGTTKPSKPAPAADSKPSKAQ